MTPEAKDYLDKAHDDLDDARKIMTIQLAKVAARSAYYAAFIIDRTGKVAKTHSGVGICAPPERRRECRQVLVTFLAQAYKYKEIGDYGLGHGAVVTDAEAVEAIAAAARFIERIAVLLVVDPPK